MKKIHYRRFDIRRVVAASALVTAHYAVGRDCEIRKIWSMKEK